MASDIQIVNTALGRIGVSELIESLDQPNTIARAAKNIFAQTRDQVLEDFPWDFAQVCQPLALVSDQQNQGWLFQYRYPNDCAKLHRVTDEVGRNWSGLGGIWNYQVLGQVPYLTIADRANIPNRLILTNMPSAYAWYSMRVADPNQFTGLFRSALAWKLAAELALSLKADRNLAVNAAQMYTLEAGNAQVHSLSERHDACRDLQSPSIIARS